MSNEETPSKEELERLRDKKELIELKARLEELRAPWWRKAGWIATITALAAAVVPITTAIQEHYRNERELTLQQAKQDSELALAQTRQQTDIAMEKAKLENDIRISYLDRFEVPGHRLQTLRFLLATSTDDRLLAWAKEEQRFVQSQVDRIEEELTIVKKKIEQGQTGAALEELKKERDELNKLRDITVKKPPPSSTPR